MPPSETNREEEIGWKSAGYCGLRLRVFWWVIALPEAVMVTVLACTVLRVVVVVAPHPMNEAPSITTNAKPAAARLPSPRPMAQERTMAAIPSTPSVPRGDG